MYITLTSWKKLFCVRKIYPFTFALPQLPEFHDLVEYSNAALVIYDAYGNCDSQAA